MGDDARGFFDENGYYLARGVYSPGEIGRLREEFDRVVHQVTESGLDYATVLCRDHTSGFMASSSRTSPIWSWATCSGDRMFWSPLKVAPSGM